MKMKKIFKKFVPLLTLFPFIIGTGGYLYSGETLLSSMYASFAIYFVNPVNDGYNPAIEVARWMAAFVTTGAVLFVLKKILRDLSNNISCLGRDSIAVYSDQKIKIFFDYSKQNIVYAGRDFISFAKVHIILLNNDIDSLEFYENNKMKMKDRKTYIALREMNYGFLKAFSYPNINFFDINGTVARTLWKKIALWEKSKMKYTITILGTGCLGQSCLNYGFQLNLFSLEQEITYNFIGEDSTYCILHKNMQTFNRDRICYYKQGDDKVPDIISTSDIIIFCSDAAVHQLQAVAILCKGELYCYAPLKNSAVKYFDFPIKMFGKDSEIYTDANICKGNLIREAMKSNYNYQIKFGNAEATDMEDEWKKLNGFYKSSNISSADFISVIKSLAKRGVDVTELAQLEHMRWCRFHHLNFWKYNDVRNDNLKLHNCLCSFEALSENDKDKDITFVKEALSQVK